MNQGLPQGIKKVMFTICNQVKNKHNEIMRLCSFFVIL